MVVERYGECRPMAYVVEPATAGCAVARSVSVMVGGGRSQQWSRGISSRGSVAQKKVPFRRFAAGRIVISAAR